MAILVTHRNAVHSTRLTKGNSKLNTTTKSTNKEKLADARYRQKISQQVMLLEREKVSGKIDWHSRKHLATDAACVATFWDSENKTKK